MIFSTQMEIIAGIVCNNSTLQADSKSSDTDVEAAPSSILQVRRLLEELNTLDTEFLYTIHC